jgi:hypothetical protein
LDEALRKALLEFPQNFGQEVLASGRAGANPQTAMAPFAEVLQPFPSDFHFAKDSLGMAKKLFTGVSKANGFAHSVQKATLHLFFQGPDRMTDGRLGQVQLASGFRERTGPRQ